MSSSNKKLVLKKLKEHNTIWHPESTVVFKSQNERLVIGRYVDGELIPLDETTLELCEEWKFKPDESLLEVDGEEDVEQQGEEDGEEDEEGQGEGAEDEEGQGEGEEDEGGQGEVEEESIKEPVIVKDNLDKKCTPKMVKNDKFVYEPLKDNVSGVLKDVAIECFSNVNSVFAQVLESRYEKTINDMSTHYVEKIENLKEELNNTKEELDKVSKDYNGIKQKFDAMKSLFN